MFKRLKAILKKWYPDDSDFDASLKASSNARACLAVDARIHDSNHEVREIVHKLWEIVPDGPYESLSPSNQALIEAGVYLAYNRIEQSIDILKDAIVKDVRYSTTINALILRLEKLVINPNGQVEKKRKLF